MPKKEIERVKRLIKEILDESYEHCSKGTVDQDAWNSFVRINGNAFDALKIIDKGLL